MQRQQASDGAEHERLRGALAALRERCASHAKERRALAAILDNKVLALSLSLRLSLSLSLKLSLSLTLA